MDSSSREARRRKIVERGSDRLALITGRIRTLPPSPSPSPSDSQSLPSSQSHDLHEVPSSTSPYDEDKAAGSVLPKNDSSSESGQINGYYDGILEEPYLRKCETSIEGLRAPALEVSSEVHSSLVTSTIQNPSISTSETEQHLEPKTHNHRFFTPNKISSAITASESTRIFCSVTVAVLVVLSYLGFPLLGSSFIKGIIFFWPLYLVLVTNLTVMLAQLILKNRRHFDRDERGTNAVPSESGYGWADQMGKALEVGLLLQKVLDAVFMDCSVYAIIVICGLSLVQQLNW